MQPNDLTNTELMREIERAQHLLSNLETERERRLRVMDNDGCDTARFAAHAAINAARVAYAEARRARDDAEDAGNHAELERLERDLLPRLRAAEEAAVEAGREVLL